MRREELTSTGNNRMTHNVKIENFEYHQET